MFLLTFILIFASISTAQDSNIEQYQFISPLLDSKLIMPESNIIIRQGDIIDPATIKEISIEVVGSISGVHAGEFILSDDLRTLIFKPFIHFTPREKVTVILKKGIYTIRGDLLNPFNFDFYISATLPKDLIEKVLEEVSDFPTSNPDDKYKHNFLKSTKVMNDSLPPDFPTLTVNVKNNPSDGYLFFAPFLVNPNVGYLTIIDNNAIPIYYHRKPYVQTDFKIQPNGLLSYGDIITRYFFIMDSSYAVVDSFAAGNGYLTDNHDFEMLGNGHSLLLAYDPQPVRMDTIVPGGDSSAIVIGLIVQELDINKNVVFQWRSWDHFKITDATEDINLTQHTIDYVHGNAIDFDLDGNLLVSCRHMDEITKINRQTGDIIWRWGGVNTKNNQFQFINDAVTFSHQHDIRRLPNGNVTFYDNGNLHSPRVTRAREYILNETEMTAELVWTHSHDPPIFKRAQGNVQTLLGNNKLIGWGGWFYQGVEAISEVKQDGSVALEILLANEFSNYRAFKFPWKTNLFVTNPDSIFFESTRVGDSTSITVDLINNSAHPVNITGYYNLDENFVVENPVPFTIQPFGNIPLHIKFIPNENGYFKDYLHIRSDTETTRIAQVMFLAGSTDSISSVVEEDVIPFKFILEQNYPNPFNPSTVINFSIPKNEFVIINVYSALGEKVHSLVSREFEAGRHSVEFINKNFSSGIYFYKMIAGNFSETKKLILLK
jgi:hypothetical protein